MKAKPRATGNLPAGADSLALSELKPDKKNANKGTARGRKMELDPGYCDVIVQRWEAATGAKASLVGGIVAAKKPRK